MENLTELHIIVRTTGYFLNYTAQKLLYFLHYPHSIVCVPELVDDGDASVPKLFLVSLHKERFQGVAEMR